MSTEYYATVRWTVDDLAAFEQTAGWTDERRHGFMSWIEKSLEERMIERGWEVIEYFLIAEDGVSNEEAAGEDE